LIIARPAEGRPKGKGFYVPTEQQSKEWITLSQGLPLPRDLRSSDANTEIALLRLSNAVLQEGYRQRHTKRDLGRGQGCS
jgi:hypothetical protein